MNRVLVVAAHADDEVLGCGGTIAKHVENGDRVELIVMTDGVSSRTDLTNSESAFRTSMLENSCQILGVAQVHQCNFPDNQMDSVPLLTIVQAVEDTLAQFTPDIVYTHCAWDLNIDHQLTHRAVMTACRPKPTSTINKILTFEVRSGTDWQPASQSQFSPNWFIDITNVWLKKQQALNAYDKEMMPWPHTRSIEAVKALAQSRGAQAGVEMAEAFFLERMVVKD